MIVTLLSLQRTGEVWTRKHSMQLGTGQRYAGAAFFWWPFIFPGTAACFGQTLEDVFWDTGIQEFWATDSLSAFETTTDEDDWGWTVEFDDADFEKITSGVVGAGKKFWVIGSGQEFVSAWLLFPAEYYIEEFDDWIDIYHWVIKLIRADGSYQTVYTTDGFYQSYYEGA